MLVGGLAEVQKNLNTYKSDINFTTRTRKSDTALQLLACFFLTHTV